jgi:hypothetical protein
MTFTNTTLNAIAENTAVFVNASINYIGVGDDNTAPTSAQTDLISPLMRKAVYSKSATGSEVRCRTKFDVTELNDEQLIETGQFVLSSAGVMISRNLLNPFNKTSVKELSIITRNIFTAKNKSS